MLFNVKSEDYAKRSKHQVALMQFWIITDKSMLFGNDTDFDKSLLLSLTMNQISPCPSRAMSSKLTWMTWCLWRATVYTIRDDVAPFHHCKLSSWKNTNQQLTHTRQSLWVADGKTYRWKVFSLRRVSLDYTDWIAVLRRRHGECQWVSFTSHGIKLWWPKSIDRQQIVKSIQTSSPCIHYQ